MAATSERTATVTTPADNEILITREFDAPARLLYQAYTTPDLVSRWWIGQRGTIKSCAIDLRVGGTWRYVMIAHGGFEVAFHGVYREIVPDEKLVTTEVFEAMPDAEALTTATFTEKEGRTVLRILVVHENQANRDAHLNSGMEGGLNEALDLLEAIAAEALAAEGG